MPSNVDDAVDCFAKERFEERFVRVSVVHVKASITASTGLLPLILVVPLVQCFSPPSLVSLTV